MSARRQLSLRPNVDFVVAVVPSSSLPSPLLASEYCTTITTEYLSLSLEALGSASCLLRLIRRLFLATYEQKVSKSIVTSYKDN